MEIYKTIVSYIQEKTKNQGIQKQARNMGWMFFARIGSMIITFVALSYIARNLGPKNYGELSYAISFVSLFAFIAALGIDQILHRDLIQHPDKKNVYLGSALVLRFLASITAVLFAVGSTFFFSAKDVSLILIFILSLSPLLGTFQLINYEFQAETQSKYPSILVLFVVLILNLAKITVIALDQGVIYLALVLLLEPILYSLGYLFLKQKCYGDVKQLSFDPIIAYKIFKDSFPLIFASAFYLIYARIDQVMLKHMIGAEAVGLYDAAVKISEVSYFIPQILLVSLFPAIINAKKTSLEIYYRRTKKLLLFLIGVTLLIAAVTTLLSKALIITIFGAGFIGSLPILCLYVWSNIGASLNAFTQQFLVTEKLSYIVSLTTFFGMFSNIVLNWYLIPVYGVLGAAFATLISYTIPFFTLFLFKKTRPIMVNILTS